MAAMTNKDAADVLFNVATILELAEDNPYRIRAYRRAARLLLRSPVNGRVRLNSERELELPGLGPRLRRKLGELFATGRMTFYVELCAELPDEIQSLMEIPHVGPKTATRLHEELGVSTPAGVAQAAKAGKIRQLYGFGVKRERQLLQGALAVLNGFQKFPAALPPEEVEEFPQPIPLWPEQAPEAA